jgi:hypothetical protein
MLEHLCLRNFQCHKVLDLELGPGVTTLVGPTGSGKTAALRGLLWLTLNQILGTDFIRWGAAYASGRLDLDGHSLIRKRGRGNTYKLDGEVLKAFGPGKVPAPVAGLLNLSQVNFQQQLDPPFWFTGSPAQVSRELNAIINLGEIDRVLEAAAREVLRSGTNVSLTRQRLRDARQARKELRWVVEFDRNLKQLEDLRQKQAAKRQKRQELQFFVVSMAKAGDRLKNLVATCLTTGRAVKLAHQARKTTARRDSLAALLSQAARYKELATAAIPDPRVVAQLAKDYRAAVDNRRVVDNLLLTVSQLEYELCQADIWIGDAERQLRKATKGKCPLCGTKLSRSPSQSPTSTSPTNGRPRVGIKTGTGCKHPT